jgi:hypothetical protein
VKRSARSRKEAARDPRQDRNHQNLEQPDERFRASAAVLSAREQPGDRLPPLGAVRGERLHIAGRALSSSFRSRALTARIVPAISRAVRTQ